MRVSTFLVLTSLLFAGVAAKSQANEVGYSDRLPSDSTLQVIGEKQSHSKDDRCNGDESYERDFSFSQLLQSNTFLLQAAEGEPQKTTPGSNERRGSGRMDYSAADSSQFHAALQLLEREENKEGDNSCSKPGCSRRDIRSLGRFVQSKTSALLLVQARTSPDKNDSDSEAHRGSGRVEA